MTQRELFYRAGVALVIGILVGLEREHAQDRPKRKTSAGMRTFAFIGLLGYMAALVADTLASPWVFVIALFLLGTLLTVAYFFSASQGAIGLTTEMAALVTALSGALCYGGQLALAAAIAVATTTLLSLKLEMRKFARSISQEDIYATLKFAVITAIVLPILPNRAFGPPPLDILNPYRIWLMVVFISGISFLGYVLIKMLGSNLGIGLTGLLGGIASSTAVTLSLAERSKGKAELGKPLALAIMIAWTVMFFRVIIVVGALNVALLRVLWAPMVVTAAVGLAYCGYLYRSQHADAKSDVAFANPFELWPTIRFGLIYATVLLISRAAQVWLGDTGIYLSSIITGLTGVDAIALSMTQLSMTAGGPALDTATRAIVLAAMSNTVVKGSIILASGSPTLRRALLPGLQLMLVTGIGAVFLL